MGADLRHHRRAASRARRVCYRYNETWLWTAIVHQPRCEPINAGLIRTSAQRYSMVTFSPSTNPISFNPPRNAVVIGA